jgi:hypothetical protein
LGHASIPTIMTYIPIPMIITLTQHSMTLHNGKVWPYERETVDHLEEETDGKSWLPWL